MSSNIIFAIEEAIIDLEMTGDTSVKAIPLKRYTDKIQKTVKEYSGISLFRWAAISMGMKSSKIKKKNTTVTMFIQQNKDKIITIEGKKYRITEISV